MTYDPTPDQIPSPVTEGSSLEVVMAQNDDLMARLRVTLRRLALVEAEQSALKKDLQAQIQHSRNLKDQLAVWNEKENLWHFRKEQLETEVGRLKEQLGFEDELKKEVSRLLRFRDRVLSYIKPEYRQLKDFANRLGAEIKRLNSDNHRLFNELNLTRKELDQKKQLEETVVASLKKQVLELEISNQTLRLEAEKVNQLLDRQDQLENQNIVLRRERDDLIHRLSKDKMDLQSQFSHVQQELIKRQVQVDDGKQKVALLESQIKKLETTFAEQKNQLDSARQLWNSKSEEVERFRISMRSLEKLNAELSRRLNQQSSKSELDH